MKNSRFTSTVKQYGTNKVEVAVLIDNDGLFCVASRTANEPEPVYTDNITDYHLATLVFDNTIYRLEGH